MKIVIIGLSITSAWGNGHATTYRGLVRELTTRGHEVLFLEQDQPWYSANRDLPNPSFCRTELYTSVQDLQTRFEGEVRNADCVIVGSYVPEGVVVGEWVTKTATAITAFYDIDTPVTLAKLERRQYEYLSPHLIERYDLYLSFTGGPTLDRLQDKFGSPHAQAFYCSVDPSLYYPEKSELRWDLGYLGTYSDDRQPTVEQLLIKPAQLLTKDSFIVAGPQYPESIQWPANVKRIVHLNPPEHRKFYNSQRFTLNVTRADMIQAGYSPSVRLFEAAACGTPIISDFWSGLDTIFLPGREILIVRSSEEVVAILNDMTEDERESIGRQARHRVLAEHTAAHRAAELEMLIAGHSTSQSSGILSPARHTQQLQAITL